MFWTNRLEIRPLSPGLPSGSSGNVGGSPGNLPVPDRWPSQRAVWESPPKKTRQKHLVKTSELKIYSSPCLSQEEKNKIDPCGTEFTTRYDNVIEQDVEQQNSR